jgi:3-deoxy-D-manno-octulosonic-acid transferase
MSEPASQTGLLRAYRGATRALGPLLPLWMGRRARAGKEDLARLNERKGIASLPRPNGPLVWMHGASVGECTMLLPLISQFRKDRPDINILITSATVTAANLLEVRLPDGCFHQYVPLDHPKYVSAFLDYWTPDTALWAESEIWPNMITEAKSRGVKMALINARMSENSLNGWAKRAASAKAVFSKFDLILAADKRTGDSLGWFTERDIFATGNLKDAGETLPANAEDLRRLQQSLAGRPIWCAASTHMGEDELILRAHEDILSVHPNALLILAPRHPERRDDILDLINSCEFTSSVRSKGQTPNKKTQVYLFDTIGEMGLAFRLAALTFVCGSLVKGLTGHNPLEPARLGSAVLTGGNTASFSETYNAMFSFGAARRVLSPEIIGKEITALFSDQDVLENLREKARRYAESRDDVLTYVWDELQPLLPHASAS